MTPEEEAVRRALAEATADDPAARSMPPEVAARLDGVLADLVAERASDPADTADTAGTADEPDDPAAGGPVVPLRTPSAADSSDRAGRARRGRARGLLVAAAAVAVVGVGLGTVLDDLTGGGNDASESAVTAESATEGDLAGPELAEGGSDLAREEALAEPRVALRIAAPAALASETLEADVARLLERPVFAAETDRQGVGPDATDAGPREEAAAELLSACALPAAGAADLLVPVRLDGRRGTLVVEPVRNGAREARVHSCADPAEVLATTRVADR